MKKLLILTLLFVGVGCYGQNKMPVYGMGFTRVPGVMKMSDGRWEVKTDSMTAIKLLWRELEVRDSTNEADKRELFKAISIQQKQLKAFKEYRNNIDKIIKSLKP